MPTAESLPKRHETEQSQLERTIADISQEVLDFEMRSEQIIRAGRSGYSGLNLNQYGVVLP